MVIARRELGRWAKRAEEEAAGNGDTPAAQPAAGAAPQAAS
jgi:hypothetical protein